MLQVFLSVGRVSSPEQETFLKKLEEKLQNRSLTTRTIGRNTFTAGLPLDRIREEMHQSRGLLVLAFERTLVESGTELQQIGEDPIVFSRRKYATPWHQVEIAMAKMLDLPILVVLQHNLHQEALLEDKHGWFVYRTKLKPSELDTDQFVGTLDDWVKRVNAKPAITTDDPADLTIGALIKRMKPAQLWSILVALAAIAAGAAALGAWAKGAQGAVHPDTAVSGPAPKPPDPPTSVAALNLYSTLFKTTEPIAVRANALLEYVRIKRAEGPFKPPGLDLHGLQLNGDARLTDADLSGLNLERADLSDTTMNGVKLTNTLLMGATLVRTNLIAADLSGTALNGADLRGALLRGVKVNERTSFIHANLCGVAVPQEVQAVAEFRTTNVHDTICPDGSVQDDCKGHWGPPPNVQVTSTRTTDSGPSGESWIIANLDAVCPPKRVPPP